MTAEQLAAIKARNAARNELTNKLSYDLWEVYTDSDPEKATKNNRVWDLLLTFHNTITNDQSALISALEAEREKVREADNDVLLLIGMIYGKSPNKEMTAVTEQIVGRLRTRATLTEGK